MKSYYRAFALFSFLIIILIGCSSKPNLSQPIWVDVRTAEEFENGHITDAINIPYEQIGAHIAQVTDNKSADLRIYCKSGRRAGIAKQELEKMGYTNVTNEGGYQDILNR